MKKLRKLVSLLLAVVMIMGLCATQVMAVGTAGTITVTSAEDGKEYSVYKLLDLTYDSQSDSYSYTIDSSSDWYTFFTTGNGASYVSISTINGVNYVTWNAGTDTLTAQEFGQKASDYAASNGVTATDSKTASGTTVEFTGLGLGYYLVTSTTGSLVELDSTEEGVEVVDKNAKPTIEKSVSNSSTGTYSGSSTAAFGDTVYYKVKIVGVNEITELTLHDILPSGFDFIEVTSILLYSSEIDDSPVTLDVTTDYTVKTDNLADSTCSFEVVLDALLSTSNTHYSAKVTSDAAYLEVYYTAKVTSSAYVYNDTTSVNTNQAWLTYGSTSTIATTNTYVYNFDVYKYDGSSTPLSGAEFTLKNGSNEYAYFTEDSGVYNLAGWVTDTSTVDTSAYTYTLISGSDGYIHIEGLDVGTYTLSETKAPTGYAMSSSTSAITVTIAVDGSYALTINGESISGTTAYEVKVVNSTSSEMPSTGGTGVVGYYVFGGVLVLAAAAVMIGMRKRKVN